MVYDKEFLSQLDQQRIRTTYARITRLTFDERPIDQIEGRVTSGSVSIDGNSAVRRTCQLNLITEDKNVSDYLWTLNTKFKLAIGLANDINSNYPDIIWFEQGVYLITSFSANLNATSYTIAISGKDKMCLLNGEISGTITDGGDYSIQDIATGLKDENGNDIMQTVKYPIKEIIRDLVHFYAQEPFHNIIINDIDEKGLALQEYRYSTPLFLYRIAGTSEYTNGTLDQNTPCIFDERQTTLGQLDKLGFQFDTLAEDFLKASDSDTVEFKAGEGDYHLAKIDFGETAGYKLTDLVYPTELMGNPGENITVLLDKIKSMLGDFEYFYNLDGQFVFQKKKTYVNTTWSPIRRDSDRGAYVDTNPLDSQYSYIFNNTDIFTSFNMTPNIMNLRNDFTVIGSRTTASGAKVPIRVRYAIDQKPIKYTSIAVTEAEAEAHRKKDPAAKNYQAQASKTYISDNVTNTIVFDSTVELEESTATATVDGAILTSENDILTVKKIPISYACDWREVLYQMARDYSLHGYLDDFNVRVARLNPQYPNGVTGYEQYYKDILGFWRDLYAPLGQGKKNQQYDPQTGWNVNVYNNPDVLPFWIDFLDSGELMQFSVANIGDRIKVKNDNKIASVYNRRTPAIIFIEDKKEIDPDKTGYRYFKLGGVENMFVTSSQTHSAKEEVDNLLYQHAYCAESVTVSCIPIYYLQPNTCIYIEDERSGIKGDYLISRVQIPLAYNGTMSITATKAPQRLL